MAAAKLIPALTIGCALLVAAGIPSGAFAQAPEQPPAGAAVTYTTEAVATVESMGQDRREVLLRSTGGNVFALLASPDVNLARLKPGDGIVVRYVEALAVSLAKSGQDADGKVTGQSGIVGAAPEGSQPAGTVMRQNRATVTINAIDHASHMVSFSGSGGAAHTVAVRDPAAQRFTDTLKVGEQVDLVYTQSLAVTIEPTHR
jgi:hypothetical protein